MPSDAEHRVWYIELRTLSNDYLSARYWFDCDNGGFELSMRVFRTADGDIIALSSSLDKPVVLMNGQANPGELSYVGVKRIQLFRYVKDQWCEADDVVLPMISLENILNKWKLRWKAHLNRFDQTKDIYLSYEVPKTGDVVPVVGWEILMEPRGRHAWAHYRLTNGRFVPID